MWRESEPFVENKRGILIHRPRSASMYRLKTTGKSHIAVRMYCGASFTDNDGDLTFLPKPPEDALLCAACEARAVMAGLPTASELAGRHVHIGKLKAVRTCCGGETETK